MALRAGARSSWVRIRSSATRCPLGSPSVRRREGLASLPSLLSMRAAQDGTASPNRGARDGVDQRHAARTPRAAETLCARRPLETPAVHRAAVRAPRVDTSARVPHGAPRPTPQSRRHAHARARARNGPADPTAFPPRSGASTIAPRCPRAPPRPADVPQAVRAPQGHPHRRALECQLEAAGSDQARHKATPGQRRTREGRPQRPTPRRSPWNVPALSSRRRSRRPTAS